jgi:glycosyltransferase involved in cell wall biosynthesis
LKASAAICLVFMDDYPWDVRIEKFIRSLSRAGYAVHLVCRNLSRRPCEEKTPEALIHRLPFFRNSFLNYMAQFPAFFNPLWIHRIYHVVRQHSARLIIVRDMPLSLAAALVARVTKVPLIIDMAENYPAMTRQLWRYGRPRVTDFAVRNPFLVKLVEGLSLRLADHIFVVVNESEQRLMREGVPPAKISVVMNTPELWTLKDLTQSAEAISLRGQAEFVVTYTGNLDAARGIDFLLRSMPAILPKIPQFRLLIVGAKGAERQLRRLAKEICPNGSVIFTGWIPHRKMLSVLLSSDACIIPHRPTPHTNTTIPNKLFDYMAVAKPVISSDLAPVRRIIEEQRCGLILRQLTPARLVECLSRLSDPGTRRCLGERGRRAILTQYNWTVAERNVLGVVRRFAPLRSDSSSLATGCVLTEKQTHCGGTTHRS